MDTDRKSLEVGLIRRWGAILLVWGLLGNAGNAFADGIVAYRNDTKQALVVQSAVVVNGSVKTSKPQTLFPGELAVDTLVQGGPRRVVIYDARKPNAILFQTDVAFNGDAFYSIVSRPRPAARADANPMMMIELVKSVPPANLPKPGTNPPPKKR